MGRSEDKVCIGASCVGDERLNFTPVFYGFTMVDIVSCLKYYYILCAGNKGI